METIHLNDFLGKAPGLQVVRNLPENYLIRGISTDSRTMERGDLFVAISGEYFDGHDFVPEAIGKGASGVVVSRWNGEMDPLGKVTVISVSDTIRFLMALAGWYRQMFQIPVVGLTGSTGKTTTKELMAAVLSTGYRVLKTEKNLNNFIGVSFTLLGITGESELAVVEMGTNHPGEIGALTGVVQPTHAAVTNIGSGHIGYFGSRQAIYEEKKALFDGMDAGTVIFVNDQDPFLRTYTNSRLSVKTFGLRKGCFYRGSLPGFNHEGCVKMRINDGPEIQLQIPGRHQFFNALLAGSVGLEFGVSPESVKKGLEAVQTPDKRMQIDYRQGVMIINDSYNANPDSVRAAIDYLCDLPAGKEARKFLILGDMLEMGKLSETEHRGIGQYLTGKPLHSVYTLGSETRFVLEEMEMAGNTIIESRHFPTHEDLARALKNTLGRGDIILLKGSRGMAMEKVLDHLDMGR